MSSDNDDDDNFKGTGEHSGILKNGYRSFVKNKESKSSRSGRSSTVTINESRNMASDASASKRESPNKPPLDVLKHTDDYYALLGVSRQATEAEIKQAYKKQAFLYHPDKNRDPNSHRAFAKISAAFDVLSNPEKRRQYDAYGLDGMKRSATFSNGTYSKSSRAKANFDNSAYHSFSHADLDGLGQQTANVVYKDPPIYHDLFVALEEIMQGAKKKVKITRKVFKRDHTSKTEEKILQINIKPGWKEGTKIIFEREGDKRPGVIPSDIIFILRDKPHSIFRRSGSDVIFTARITLKSALMGDRLMIPMLSGEKKLLRWSEVVHPRTEKRLKGMGLPFPQNPSQRGDLVVHFDIIFPKTLTNEERQLVGCALPPFSTVSGDF